MKLIGFIKEHNNIAEASEYKNILDNKVNNNEIIDKIINYLNNGVYILGWMNTIRAIDNNELIAPHCYLTDGSFIWPAYYSYYLKKYTNYKIDTNFLEHLEKINFDFKSIKVSDELKKELEKQLSENLKY